MSRQHSIFINLLKTGKGISKMTDPATNRKKVIWCLLNISSSISVVFVNKLLFKMSFPNMQLTCFHFIATFLMLFVTRKMGMFEQASVPIREVIPLSISFCGFVVLTNLSLQFNTVGTYQLIKALTTPCIMLIDYFYYSKTYSLKVKLTLIPITCGVFLNSCFDIKFSLIGTIFALVGVLVTSVYQILVGVKQKELKLNSMQLLFYQAPVSAVMLLCVIPFFEPLLGEGSAFDNVSAIKCFLVVLSGFIAYLVNVSIYWVIGNTSPVTYNMVGHLKFSTILIGGFVLFQDPISLYQGVGMLLTVSGVIAYTHFKLSEPKTDNVKPVQSQFNPVATKQDDALVINLPSEFQK